MSHYVITVPVNYEKDGQKLTRYHRVGALFENHNRDTGKVYYNIKLDFPVGATELVAFAPKARDEEDGEQPA